MLQIGNKYLDYIIGWLLVRCKDTKLFLINNHKDHNLRRFGQNGNLTDRRRMRPISLIKKVLLISASFGWQAALRIVFIDQAEMEEIEDVGETRTGKRNPIYSRNKTKIA